MKKNKIFLLLFLTMISGFSIKIDAMEPSKPEPRFVSDAFKLNINDFTKNFDFSRVNETSKLYVDNRQIDITALQAVALKGSTPNNWNKVSNIANTLLSAGADPNLASNGETALCYAIKNSEDTRLIQLLLRYGAQASSQGLQTCFEAVEHKIEELKKNADRFVGQIGSTPGITQQTVDNINAQKTRLEQYLQEAKQLVNDYGSGAKKQIKFPAQEHVVAAVPAEAPEVVQLQRTITPTTFIDDAWEGNFSKLQQSITAVRNIDDTQQMNVFDGYYPLTALQAATIGGFNNKGQVLLVVNTLLRNGADPDDNLTGFTGSKKFSPVWNALKNLDHQTFFALADKYNRWDLIEQTDVLPLINKRADIIQKIQEKKGTGSAKREKTLAEEGWKSPLEEPKKGRKTLSQLLPPSMSLEDALGQLVSSLNDLSDILKR